MKKNPLHLTRWKYNEDIKSKGASQRNLRGAFSFEKTLSILGVVQELRNREQIHKRMEEFL